ncbi:MAG: hypothetical protein ACOYYS_10040 [Chloroflexota bacterium]
MSNNQRLGRQGLSRDAEQVRVLNNTVPPPSGTTDHGGLLGLADDDHTQYLLAVSAAGAGLTVAGRVLAVGAGAGLTVGVDDVGLQAPGTLSVSSANNASGSHTHAVTSSSNPGAAASILASDSNGKLQLVGLGAGVSPSYPLHARATSEQLRLEYSGALYASLVVDGSGNLRAGAVGNITLDPDGDLIIDPAGNDTYPATNYAVNSGLINKKWLRLHAAELWVETLVAQDTVATIGGRILVCPTTTLEADIGTGDTLITTKHDQMTPGDIAYMEADGKVEFMRIEGLTGYWLASSGYGTFVVDAAFGDITAHFPAGTACVFTGYGPKTTNSDAITSGSNTWLLFADDGFPTPVSDEDDVLTSPYPLGSSAPYTYQVTRNLDGSGANVWYAGDALANTGQTGNGFIDLYSLRGVKSSSQAGPTIVGNVRNSATYNDWSEHWAIGNLNGLYGYGTTTYGVGLGKYANGQSFVLIDSTNGLRMRKRASGSDSTQFQLQVDGDLFIGEAVGSAATTFLSVFVNAQTYNTESMSAGDVLIGDNSASKANILWDKSAGKLQFRGGQTMQLELSTSGALVAGGGNITIDAAGFKLGIDTDGSDYTSHIRFMDGSTIKGQLYYYEGLAFQGLLLSGNKLWCNFPTDGLLITGDVDLDSGNLSVSGDISCSAQISTNGGTTQWDLGGYTSGSDVSSNGYVTVTIDGTPYKLMTRA